jgi:tRNA threonylcarbamoyladenosine biosynthesis protein TsaE
VTKEFTVISLEELPAAAEEILNFCSTKKIFAFLGEMGSGKTTVIGALCRTLGVKSKISSPTFAIVNEYHEDSMIFHMDLYRLNTIQEALDIGIEEYLSGRDYCFIEWPQLIESLLPEETVFIVIEVLAKQQRKITITNSWAKNEK